MYKHPDYSSDFFKGGGLIPGSNIAERKLKALDVSANRNITFPLYPGRILWKDRVKQDELSEDLTSVTRVGDWETAILKEVNPKWRDPDTIELPDPKTDTKKLDKNTGAKGLKKGKK